MCLPIGGRKEVVSLMQQQSEKISYLSGKMSENVHEKELLSLWNDVGRKRKTPLLEKRLLIEKKNSESLIRVWQTA